MSETERVYTIPMTRGRMSYFRTPAPLSTEDEAYIRAMMDLFLKSIVKDAAAERADRERFYDTLIPRHSL